MDDSLKIQMDIKNNAEDLRNYLMDLRSWEDEMKEKEKKLQSEKSDVQVSDSLITSQICFPLLLKLIINDFRRIYHHPEIKSNGVNQNRGKVFHRLQNKKSDQRKYLLMIILHGISLMLIKHVRR